MKPVHFHKDKWWFWDETWSEEIGPYNSKKEAYEGFNHYCNTNLNPTLDLTLEKLCMCECHKDGENVMHFMACCILCYCKYIDVNGDVNWKRLKIHYKNYKFKRGL